MTEATPFLQKYDITFLRPPPISRGFKGDTLFLEREYLPLAHSRTVRESPDGLRPS